MSSRLYNSSPQGKRVSPVFSIGCAHFAQTGSTKSRSSPFFSNPCAHLQKQWGAVLVFPSKNLSFFVSSFAFFAKSVHSCLPFSTACALFVQNDRGVPLSAGFARGRFLP